MMLAEVSNRRFVGRVRFLCVRGIFMTIRRHPEYTGTYCSNNPLHHKNKHGISAKPPPRITIRQYYKYSSQMRDHVKSTGLENPCNVQDCLASCCGTETP